MSSDASNGRPSVSIDGEKLRSLRIKAGFSQEKLAAMANVNRRTIQRAEAGEPLSLETLAFVAEALEVDPASLQAGATQEDNEMSKAAGTESVDSRNSKAKIQRNAAMFGVAIVLVLAAFRAFAPKYDWPIPENPTLKDFTSASFAYCLSTQDSSDRFADEFCICLTSAVIPYWEAGNMQALSSKSFQAGITAQCNFEVNQGNKWQGISIESLYEEKSGN